MNLFLKKFPKHLITKNNPSLMKFSYFNFNSNLKREMDIVEKDLKKTFLSSYTIGKSFFLFTKTKTYINTHRYFILAITAPVFISCGYLFLSDFIYLTFYPYTFKANINSLLMISMFIKGIAYKTMLDLSMQDKIPQLVAIGLLNILWGLILTSTPMPPPLLTFSYVSFYFTTMFPLTLTKVWSPEVILLVLCFLLLTPVLFKNQEKWNETLTNEGKIDKAIAFHRMSSDEEFARGMDEYVKYLQQYDVNLLPKKI
jgi:hypothetical protein